MSKQYKVSRPHELDLFLDNLNDVALYLMNNHALNTQYRPFQSKLYPLHTIGDLQNIIDLLKKRGVIELVERISPQTTVEIIISEINSK